MAIEDVTEIVPEVATITPFQKLVLSIGEIPTNYLDSMSYAEQVTWFCMFLQEKVLPVVNQHSEKILEIINYLNNLDLQDEVNNKLDEMVESGQLQEIIAEYLNANALWCFDNVQGMKEATNLIDGSYAKTLGYHSKNDNGKALYKIRTITNNDVVNEMNILSLNDENLIAELIENDINIKQLGAYGDDSHDDTVVIQYALTNFDKVYIPKGTYKITDSLTLKSSNYVYGDGEKSTLKAYFTYNDSVQYIIDNRDQDSALTKVIIEKLQFISNNVDSISGGIYIEFSTRGLILNDLWFNSISNPIKLGNKIWAISSLNNIYITYFPDNLDESLTDIPCGIYCEGNTIYGKNIEILGCFIHGLYLNGCDVGNWNSLNISGSTDTYQMKNAIYVNNSNDININTGWIEQISDGSGVLSKSCHILNSKQIELNNLHIASGSIFVDGSDNIILHNTRYYQTSAGLRYLNNSKITCDLISLGYCNYQSNEEYTMGTIDIIDFNNISSSNIKNNPLYFLGIQEDIAVTNANNVTKTSDTTHQFTADRCFNFNAINYQGAQIDTSNIVEIDKKYTILAYVRINSNNVDKIYFNNSGYLTSTSYPNETYKNVDNNTDYHLIRYTGVVSNVSNAIKIIVKTKDNQACDFIIDSIFIVDGEHNNDIPSAISKSGLMKNSKLFATVSPWSGVWNKGDIVYNNFNSNTSLLGWIYDGTQWISK